MTWLLFFTLFLGVPLIILAFALAVAGAIVIVADALKAARIATQRRY